MPDEDELGSGVDDVLLVEALMGWDGETCECPDCDCPRFRDGTDPTRCPECVEGRHWPAGVP